MKTMESNFCTHCGTALAGQIVCPNCGTESAIHNARSVTYGETYSSPPHVPDYLIWSIISVLYAGVFGIIALVFSILCRNDLSAGRYDSAMSNSKVAFWCNVIPLIILVFAVASFIVFAVLAATLRSL
jgi:predicted RNA-binding Zn-ribbon protein involved in translation (DUF1610 family)